MRSRKLLWISFGVIFVAAAAEGFSQVQTTQNRIPQQVIVNGQRVNGVYVTAEGGGLQSFTCPNPQQYVTPDGASQGWACYEQATGVWLLNALPPAQVQTAPAPVPYQQPPVIYQAPPAVIYQQPAPIVVYSRPAYGYYGYPVVVAPAYPPSVVLGAAAINATGRIVSSALLGPRYSRHVYYGYPQRHWRR